METLRNFFHTDKWWGKTIFVILTYVVFWCVFYGSWLVIPYDSTVESNDDFIYIFLVYLFFIIPSASLFVVRFLRKTTFIKKLLIYYIIMYMVNEGI